MNIIDVNILVYLVNRHAEQHAAIRQWWDSTLSIGESIRIPWQSLLGFLRISTNPRAMTKALSGEDAVQCCISWLAQPNVTIVTESEGHFALLSKLAVDVGAVGGLMMDANLAALAISHDATLISCDNDFAKFPGLRWINPLEN